MDFVRFSDWQKATMQINLFAILTGSEKVPLDDNGIAIFVQEMKSSLLQGQTQGGIVPGSITVSGPKASDIPATQRKARILPNLKYGYEYDAATHTVQVQGTVSF